VHFGGQLVLQRFQLGLALDELGDVVVGVEAAAGWRRRRTRSDTLGNAAESAAVIGAVFGSFIPSSQLAARADRVDL
jgi:hypothetical protein